MSQRLEAVFRRAKRSCLCSSDLPSLAQLIDSADKELFFVGRRNEYRSKGGDALRLGSIGRYLSFV